MSVYVDELRYPFGRMVMCHMLADSLDELHAMAERIGIHRRHFQNAGRWQHYDICKAKRALALRYGAISLDSKSIIRRLRAIAVRADKSLEVPR